MTALPTPSARTVRTSFAPRRDRAERRRRVVTNALLVVTLSVAILLVTMAVAEVAHAASLDAGPAGRVGIAAVLSAALAVMALTTLRLIRRAAMAPRRRPRRRG